jgi:hypothetical protein
MDYSKITKNARDYIFKVNPSTEDDLVEVLRKWNAGRTLISTSEPDDAAPGDFWYDENNKILKFKTDSGWYPIFKFVFGLGVTDVEQDDGTLVRSVYLKLDSLPGKQGVQGEQGERGEKGEKGDKGDTGEQGLQGFKGDKGDKGIKGDKGEKGDKGDRGEQGLQGIPGTPGEKGEAGERGEKGEPGVSVHYGSADGNFYPISGPAGEKGEKGDDGAPGAQGQKGDQGEKGDKGEKGDSGTADPISVIPFVVALG